MCLSVCVCACVTSSSFLCLLRSSNSRGETLRWASSSSFLCLISWSLLLDSRTLCSSGFISILTPSLKHTQKVLFHSGQLTAGESGKGGWCLLWVGCVSPIQTNWHHCDSVCVFLGLPQLNKWLAGCFKPSTIMQAHEPTWCLLVAATCCHVTAWGRRPPQTSYLTFCSCS